MDEMKRGHIAEECRNDLGYTENTGLYRSSKFCIVEIASLSKIYIDPQILLKKTPVSRASPQSSKSQSADNVE